MPAITITGQVSILGKLSAKPTPAAGPSTSFTLWTWGKNNYGQLGNGVAGSVDVSSPTQVGNLTDWTVFISSFI